VRTVPRITHLEWRRLDVPLLEPFGIATGAQLVAENLVLELGTDDGTLGLGEAAPFPAVNGETRNDVELALETARPRLLGLPLEPVRETAVGAAELFTAPSARCAFETALFDAFAKHCRTSLFEFFGGREARLTTDITLTTGDALQAATQATSAAGRGFRTLKIKIGGATLEHDRERILAAARAAPDATLVLDANASFDAGEALALLDSIGAVRERIALFEQPVGADDLAGLGRVRAAGVRVAADESVKSADDVARLVDARAVDVVNVKIMKAGLVAAWDTALAARARGLGLMIGGMVETRLAMSASACLAGGLGGFSFVDLDTPLFLASDPFVGGFDMRGPELWLGEIRLGHGVGWRAGQRPGGC
jgi:L-alanine-DL-glutamate epimerase-like enolase superfamily enzyme